jgi:uncharacterized protein (DUF488 family)
MAINGASQFLLTIGHSNRPLPEFVDLLEAHRVGLLVDVRAIPRSRYNPQFNRETLADVLIAHRIAYEHLPGLGGLRHPRKDSINTGWRNDSFRGYADYMQTEEYARNLDNLVGLETSWQAPTEGKTAVAIMCAEAVPWRCHRSLIADSLTARGIPVAHIMSASKTEPHKLTTFARIAGATVTYPGPILNLFEHP